MFYFFYQKCIAFTRENISEETEHQCHTMIEKLQSGGTCGSYYKKYIKYKSKYIQLKKSLHLKK